MKMLIPIVALICLGGQSLAARTLTSPILTNWGTWGEMERCAPGMKGVFYLFILQKVDKNVF